jgi:hypothetical protein
MVLGFFLVSVAPAAAQTKGVDVTAAYQWQRLTCSGCDSTNYPAGFDVDVAGMINSTLSWVGQFDWSRKSESNSFAGGTVDASQKLSTFGGGVRWFFPNGGTAAPYVQGVVGATHESFSCSASGGGVTVSCPDSSDTKGMIQVGIGVAPKLTDKLAGVAQFDYRRIFTEGEGTNSIRFIVGVRFKVGG